jgi:hypothetical protein
VQSTPISFIRLQIVVSYQLSAISLQLSTFSR